MARQRGAGIDLVNDGEYGHSMGHRYDYGSWWAYAFQRLGGLELVDYEEFAATRKPPKLGEIGLGGFERRRDMLLFDEAYADPGSGAALPAASLAAGLPVCRGPITYIGEADVARDIANMKSALAAAGVETGYLNAVAPGSCARIGNEYYDDDVELLYACADAMRNEYKAILDAGLWLQLDDPGTAESWDQIAPQPSVEEYRRYTMVRVEALNHAIRDLPNERIRYHLCWGSWHGPHVTDIALADILEPILAVNAACYSFEAANVRHEHEWRLWGGVGLPAGKQIMPGVVSHATNVVEHPELVADRIVRFAECVGRENVVASTDCGLGGRVHPQIAWAKLEALAQGARLASERLWR
ncbi:MAG TPA: cobalamin-independent methionine synthase II family protein [Solirubrobacteraceae bacterium]|nr:cobalamin-independent methionine synthase II family protein [Solirubrobacteraceae bacterium]